MSASDLLRRLDDLGVGLTLDGDRIRYRGQSEALTADLLAEMKERRDELVALLSRRMRLRWPPPAREQVGGASRRGPLTAGQRALWATGYFLEDGTYNVSGALRLRGRLDTAALEAALADVYHRHPSLRTVFPLEHGEPYQLVLALDAVAVPRLTADVRPAATLEECLDDAAHLGDRALPLDTAPPVRTRLYRLTGEDHVFLVVLHHILADAVSVAVLLAGLATCYNARLRGAPAGPPPDRLDMIDYARWEEEHLRYADLSGARRYWRDRLAGAELGALPLPPPPPDGRTERGSAVTATVDAPTTAAVRNLMASSRSSAFAVVSAALAAMLSRYTGREDLVVGMPVARRDREGLEDLVGLLLETVPIRLDTGAATFLDLVRSTRNAVLGAAGNATVPHDVLVGELVSRGDATGRSLFNVVVADSGTRLAPPRFQGLVAEELEVPRVGAKFDLNFLFRDDGDSLTVDLEFDRRAVSEPDARGMLATATEILAEGVDRPGRRPVDLATGRARSAAGTAQFPGLAADDSLVGRLSRVARERREAVAVCHGTRSLSYEDLDVQVDRVAGGLRRHGVAAGEIVAVALPRCIDLVVAMLAIMRAGAACLVLDDSWPRDRVDRILADAGATRTIGPDGGQPAGDLTVAQLMEDGAAVGPCPAVPSCAIAYVIYTSGSTGTPKGVHVSHRNLLCLVDGTAGRFRFGASDTWTLFHACSFDVSMYEIFGCLLHGGRLVVVPQEVTREPEAFAALLREERVTVLSQTPSALAVTLPAIARHPGAAEHLRYVLLAGEPLERRLVDQWHREVGGPAQLVNMYGTTETTVHASWHWLRPYEAGTDETSIGGPLPGSTLHVLHSNGTPVADRCVGEIYIGGPQVSVGYRGRPRETAMRFVPDPFSTVPGARMYRSGDLGRRVGADIAYLGRRDAQVKVSGFRVELSEVEAALTAQPGVAAAAAAVRREPSGDSSIVSVVVADPGAAPSTAGVLRGVRATVPRYLVPHSVAVVDALPLTTNGKIDRNAVVARATTAASSPAAPAAPPRNATEALLLELFRQVLPTREVTTGSDFFDLGGDSMRAIRLVGLARDHGLVVRVQDVYDAPAVTDLACRASDGGAGLPAAPGARSPFRLLPPELAGTFPADVVDAYPMTALQSGMVYLQEIAPNANSYHIVLSYRVRGTLDPEAFRVAAQAVTDAHPALRTSFDLGHSFTPMQRVHAAVEVPVRFEDLRSLEPPAADERVRQIVETETATRFDFARPPLFRLVAVALPGDTYQVVFTHHHSILDGWSVNVFFDDLYAQYRARTAGGRVPPLRAPRSTFADYVALERAALEDTADRAFWRERTSSDVDLIAPDRSGEPTMRQLHLEMPGLIGDLRTVASRVGVPLKALLLAAHVRVVSWLTGSDRVAISQVFACRPEEQDSERVIGLFLNQLPMQLGLGGQSWAALARQVHQEEQEMMRHRWYPYAAIQEYHGPHPIFDSSFNFTDYHTTRQLVQEDGLELLEADELESTHYAFGSNYTIDVRTGGLRLILEYDASALALPMVTLAGEAHRRILAAMSSDATVAARDTALPGAVDLARVIATQPDPPQRRGPDMAGPLPSASGPPAGAPDATGGGPAAPRTPMEQAVRDVWAEVLGPGEYGLHRSFFDVGGTSLTAMQVVSRLRARHGPLSMRAFMGNPTIAGNALVVGGDPGTPAQTKASAPAEAAGDTQRRYPLSRAQHQMWLISQKLPGVPLFGMPGALQADGPLDVEALTRTISLLVGRHQALRTRVEHTPVGPELVVEPYAEPDLTVVDLRAESDPVTRCERLMLSAVRQPFDLGRAPLMRAVVYRLADERYVLFFNLHHIVCDGWSLYMLLQEAAEMYRDPDAAALRPPVRGLGDVARERAALASSPRAAEQLDYWVGRLAPPWPSLRSGPASRFADLKRTTLIESLRSASCERRLDRATVAAMRDAAARHDLTDFMIVLSAYAWTLRSWSGQRDIRIATQLLNRADPETEEVVGLLANTVVLRMAVDEGADRVEVSRWARQVCVDAFENHELPFEDVLAALETTHPQAVKADPVFEVMIVMQVETPEVYPADELTFAPYQSRRDVLGAPIAATSADFVLGATPADGEMVLNLLYRPATTARSFAEELLEDVAAGIAATAQALAGDPS